MRRPYIVGILVLLCAIGQVTQAQVDRQVPAAEAQLGLDDSLLLTYTDFLGVVLENHPIAKQAALRGQTGAQYLRVARGAFDPYLAAGYDAKQFAGKNYWQVLESSVRIPTWFGTELYAGFNSATAPRNGSTSAGSMRPKCRSDRWTTVLMRGPGHATPRGES